MSDKEKTVDDRVLSMRFDNSKFEKNVEQSMKTLDRLKKSLNMDSAAKGFDELNKASKNVSFDGLTTGVENIKNHFSAMEVVGITALANITTAAMRAGANMVKSLTLDQVTSGFNEYELKMGSIQTIMAGTGESLQTVTSYLNELNEYSDKTIYSFSDMTQSIGKFTNAGVSLDKAVAAIKGISNEAAVSGANAQEASRAMYNFAQALSAGYVKLIDWKSIEYANMATKEFKQQLIDTAVELGTLKKVGEDTYQTLEKGTEMNSVTKFNDTLEEQWLTTDVLVKTLERYADETTDIGAKATDAATKVRKFTQLMDTLKEAVSSGWGQTFELIVGNFNEATDLFTGLSDYFGDIIGKIAESRNAFVGGAMSSSFLQLTNTIEEAGIKTDDFTAKLKEVGIAHGVLTEEMIEEAGSLEKSLKSGWLSGDIVKETINSFIGGVLDVSDTTSIATSNLEEFSEIVDKVIRGDFGNGADRMAKMAEAGYDYATIQSLVNSKLQGAEISTENLTKSIVSMSDEQLIAIGYTEEQVATLRQLADQATKTGTPINELINNMTRPSGRELLIESIQNVWSSLTTTLRAVRAAWKNTTDSIASSDLYNVLERINKSSKKLLANVQNNSIKIQNTFHGIFSIIDLICKAVKFTLNAGLKIFSALVGGASSDVLSLTSNVGNLLFVFHDWVLGQDKVTISISKFVDMIVNAIVESKNWIREHVDLKKSVEKIVEAFTTLKKIFDGLFGILSDLVKEYGIVQNVQNGVKNITDKLSKSSDKLGDRLSAAKDGVKKFAESLEDIRKNSKGLDALTESFKSFKENVLDKLFGISDLGTEETGSKIEDFSEKGSSATQTLGDKFVELKDKVVSSMEAIKEAVSGDFMAQALSVGILSVSMIFVKKMADLLGSTKTAIFDFSMGIKGVLTNLSKVLKAYSHEINARALVEVGKAIMILVGAIAALALIAHLDTKSLLIACGVLAGLILALAGLSVAMSKFDKSATTSMISAAALVVGFSVAIAVLAGAIKSLDGVTIKSVIEPLGILVTLIALMIASMAILSHSVDGVAQCALEIIAFAVAMKILVSAIKDLTSVEMDKMSIGHWALLIGIVASIITLMAISKTAGEHAMQAGAAMVAIGVALNLMVEALNKFVDFDTSKLSGKHVALLVGFFAATIGLFAISKLAGEHALKAGVSLVAIAVFMSMMIGIIEKLQVLDTTNLGQAISAVSLMIMLISVIMMASSYVNENAGKAALLLLSLSGAMITMSLCVVMLGSIDADKAKQGCLALATIMLTLGGLLMMANTIRGSWRVVLSIVGGVAALSAAVVALSFVPLEKLKVAVASISLLMGLMTALLAVTSIAKSCSATIGLMVVVIATLTACLSTLATMDNGNGNIVEAAKGMAISLGVLTAAIIALSVAAALLGPSSAFIIAFGVALAALGVGVLSIGAGLALIAVALEKFTPMVENGAESLVNTITIIVSAIAGVIPLMASQLATGIASFCSTIAASASTMAKSIATVIAAVLDSLATVIPSVINLIRKVISALLDTIIELSPKIVEAGFTVLMCFLNGINDNIHDIIEVALSIIANFINGIADGLPKVIDAGFNLIVSFINGLADAIDKNTPKLMEAMNRLGESMLHALLLVISGGNEKFAQAGVNLIQGFKNGIQSMIGSVVDTVSNLGRKVISKLKKVLDIHSPSREAIDIARLFDLGLIKGLVKYSRGVEDASESIGNTMLSNITKAISGASNAIQNGVDNMPVIRPVIDLSDVRAGVNSISGMFDNRYELATNVGSISAMMNAKSIHATNDDVVSAIGKLRKDISNIQGNTYNVNGITYDDGSNIAGAIETLVRAARIERRS